jgi:pantoate--beta-alanine ligase
MRIVTTTGDVRSAVRSLRAVGGRVAFVPTMGNLHAGHLRLVESARARADRVVVSIFVNPLQFPAGEDFDAYPRTPEEDARLLAGVGADLLFLPGTRDLYPRGLADTTRVEVPGLSNILCGAHRPGHFVGVATVVTILLNTVAPDLALFGEKDYQQLLVIRRLVEDLRLPVEVGAVPTVREADGLAMSSRNAYLTPAERARAPALFAALGRAAADLEAGAASLAEVEAVGLAALAAAGMTPDYFSVRVAADLREPRPAERELVVLAAARLGRARLIDNLRCTRRAVGDDEPFPGPGGPRPRG